MTTPPLQRRSDVLLCPAAVAAARPPPVLVCQTDETDGKDRRLTGCQGVSSVVAADRRRRILSVECVKIFRTNWSRNVSTADRWRRRRPRRDPDVRHFFAGVSRTHTAPASRRCRSLVPPSGLTYAQQGRPSTRWRSRPSRDPGFEWLNREI